MIVVFLHSNSNWVHTEHLTLTKGKTYTIIKQVVYISAQFNTSGAIQRYVPASVVISASASSLANPKSASLIVVLSSVRSKLPTNVGNEIESNKEPSQWSDLPF